MYYVRVQIIRYVDDYQPGWVECAFQDAWGREWMFIDKLPIFTEAYLDEQSNYPQPGFIACEIIRTWRDDNKRELISIDTSRPWGIEATDGETQFDVLAEQIVQQS
jgi:hypothetical protein